MTKTTRFFLITGLDAGVGIEPYIVETYASAPDLEVRGDMSRSYEQITEQRVKELTKQGVQIC